MPSEKGKSEDTEIELVKVKKNEAHAKILYELLKLRSHNISHKAMPSLEEHTEFVLSHPYRAWYLLRLQSTFIGSIYLLRSNNIGVSVHSPYERHIASALNQLRSRYAPLPAIKSVRAAVFSINIAPANNTLISLINEMGGELVQHTYVLPSSISDSV